MRGSKLTDRTKARILAKKDLQLGTQTAIAMSENLSRVIVNRVTPERVSEKVLALVPIETEKLAERIKRVRDKALRELEYKIDNGEMPGHHLTTAFGVLYDKSRLEDGLSTANVAHAIDPQVLARNYVQSLRDKGYDRETIEAIISEPLELGGDVIGVDMLRGAASEKLADVSGC